MNGSAWFSAEHLMVESGKGFTDASGRRWGGFIGSAEGKFEAAADFEDHMLSYHIGQKEAVGLRNVLVGFERSTSLNLSGKLFVINIDNQGLFEILGKGGSSKDKVTTDICKELFWVQVFQECHFKYQWVPTHVNQADGVTRENPNNDIRLKRRVREDISGLWSLCH